MEKIKISPELLHLIKAALQLNHELPFDLYQRPVHWDRLSRLANWHQIRPLLFDYIQNHHLEDMPQKHLQLLRDYTVGQAVTNMAFLGVSLNLYKQLTANQIPAFLMKGALWPGCCMTNLEVGNLAILIFLLIKIKSGKV